MNTSQANERIQPRNFSELLPEGKYNDFLSVEHTQLAYVNYAALRRDFPVLNVLEDRAIDAWILKNFSYISISQHRLNGIRNTSVPSPSASLFEPSPLLRAMRMPWGGRSSVFEAILNHNLLGLIDLKGIGIKDVYQAFQSLRIFRDIMKRKTQGEDVQQALDQLHVLPYTDGLMSLGEAIAETSRQQAVQMLFDLYNEKYEMDYQTVETYFIIVLPFQILKEGGRSEPAAIYGRQAHFGRQSGLLFPQEIFIDDYGHRQSTFFQALIDYGGVMVQDPRLVHLYTDPIAGGDLQNPQHSLAWAKGHEVAHDFMAGNTQAVYEHLRRMLAPIQAEWEKLGDRVQLIRDPSKENLVVTMKSIEQAESIRPLVVIQPHADLYGLFWNPLLIERKMTAKQALEVLKEKAQNPKFEFHDEIVLKAVGERRLHNSEIEQVLIKIIINPRQPLATRIRATRALRTNEGMSNDSILILLKRVNDHRLPWFLRFTSAEALIASHSRVDGGKGGKIGTQEIESFHETILSIANKNLTPLQKGAQKVEGAFCLLNMLKINPSLKRDFIENHFELASHMIQILAESLGIVDALEKSSINETRYDIFLKIKDLLDIFHSEPEQSVGKKQFAEIAKAQGLSILTTFFYELQYSTDHHYKQQLTSLLQFSPYKEIVKIYLDFCVTHLIEMVKRTEIPGLVTGGNQAQLIALYTLGNILQDPELGPLSVPAKRDALKFLNSIKRGQIESLANPAISPGVQSLVQNLILKKDRLQKTVAACRRALKTPRG